jgi:hypothetical protein
MFIMRSGKRVLIRRGEPQGSAYGGVDDRRGPLWPLDMTAESSNASPPVLRCFSLAQRPMGRSTP